MLMDSRPPGKCLTPPAQHMPGMCLPPLSHTRPCTIPNAHSLARIAVPDGPSTSGYPTEGQQRAAPRQARWRPWAQSPHGAAAARQ